MKKKQNNLMQRLGKKISHEEFQKDASNHIFSDKYENEKANNLRNIELKDKMKNIRRKKTLVAAACLVILCIPASVFAATAVISHLQVKKEQTNKYAYEYNFEDESTATEVKSELYHSSVKFDYGYLPDGYIEAKSSDNKRSNKFALNDDWYSNQNLTVVLDGIDEQHKLSFNNVIKTTDMKIGENDASLLYLNSTDINKFNKIFLVFYNDYGYALQIYAQESVPDEELIKIAQNFKLVQCSSDEAENAYFKLSTDTTVLATTSTTPTTITPIDDSKFLNIGNSFSGFNYYMSIPYNSPDLTYTVENVEFKDSIAGLPTSGFGYNYKDVLQVVDADGNLAPYIQKEITKGDGITSVDTVVGETTSELKLVYVTMKVKNTSNTLLTPVRIVPSMCCLNNTNGVLSLPTTYTTTAVNSWGSAVYCDRPTKYDENPNDTSDSKQELIQTYSVQPQEEFEYHLAFIVEASQTKNMLLYFNPEGQISTKSSALQTIIKLY